VIAVLHFRPAVDVDTFQEQARAALTALAARPGFVRASVGRATDDAAAWVMVTEWESVGAYRRGLGGYDVKLIATPLLAQALDQPTAFEVLISVADDGSVQTRPSDRALDADWIARTEDS
jgi:quinol monooxygenase YgiN